MNNGLVKKLVYYGKVHLGLNELDSIYVENVLYRKLKLVPCDENIDLSYINDLKVPDILLDELRVHIRETNLVSEENIELFIVEIMGDITPLPSQVASKFNELKDKYGNQVACNYLLDLEIKNNYIQKTAVDKNIYWKAEFSNNFLEITINMSKPEKNNKDIAKLISAPKTTVKYPKCLLCIENLGYQGRSDHPARENIRIIPLTLNNEDYFMQYSPYVYYDHHCIVINNEHRNMSIDRPSFNALLDFVDVMDNYFIGSNSDLPIVGGSILNHAHFQGGSHLMPLMYSNIRYTFNIKGFEDVSVNYLDWYNSTFLIKGVDKNRVLDCASHILEVWKGYSDEEADILAYTDNRHNTITPIVRKVNNEYYMYLILRNNRCNEKHPDGIFHAHQEYFNIKKEGIGLIEAMGLFILPARLKRQMGEVEYLLDNSNISLEEYFKDHEDMKVHKEMILALREKTGDSKTLIQNYINNVCKEILECTAVFKNTELGQEHLKRFVNAL